MSNSRLEGIRAKVERARATLADLETGIGRHRETEARRLEIAARNWGPLAVDIDEPDTLYEYAVAVGEVAYNLRSGLDHLVWQLVLANGETPDTRTEFPIFQNESGYRESAGRKLRGLTDGQLQTVEGLQPFRDDDSIGPHLWMLHAICNIDKHRHLNVVSTHSIVSAHIEGEVPPELVPRSMTAGLGLLDLLRDTGYEHLVKVEVVIEVCFIDPGLEQASPAYGSPFETVGTIKRPPVVPVLKSCLAAVVNVVERLTGEATEVGMLRKVRHNCV